MLRLAVTPLWLAACLLALALVAARGAPETDFTERPKRAPQVSIPASFAPIARHEVPDAGQPAHHAGHLVRGASGNPLLFWFAGSREGAADVRILRSSFNNGAWTTPEAVLTPQLASALCGRWIKKLGNPVAWRAPDGRLHLYVVAVSLGGWSGSRILHLDSDDDGRTFASGRIQVLSPFLNFSTLVKSPAIALNGKTYLPVYHEFIRKNSLLTELNRHGEMRTAHRFCQQDDVLQPAVVKLGENAYLAVHRKAGDLPDHVFEQTSRDGEHWTPACPGDLPNPGSAVALATLPDGRAVIAFNDAESDRKTLRLAVRDAAGHWRRTGPVINSAGEVSYPTLLSGPDALHLVYTFDRKRLVHNSIPYAKLAEPEVFISAQ